MSRQSTMMPAQQMRSRRPTVAGVIRAMRCHQWVKNILLFVPMCLAHQVTSPATWLAGLAAFFCFSLVASAVYIANDILDIEADRTHPYKRHRPLASGQLQIKTGWCVAAMLMAAGLGLSAWLVSARFSFLAGAYAIAGVAYSLYFKRQPILDVLLLAGFYTHRVVLGGIAAQVEISPWLLGFSVFFFMSLAMLKRFADLIQLEKSGQTNAEGRFYTSADLPIFRSIGPATSCTSLIVLAMYISSEKVARLYQHPDYLWFVCPALFYWTMRAWFLANRGEMHHDPVVFALRDKISHLVAVLVAAIIVAAAL